MGYPSAQPQPGIYPQQPPAYTPTAQPQPPRQAVVQPAQGIFDQGARFDPNRPPSIPVSANNY